MDIASIVILGPESSGTHGHMLLSHDSWSPVTHLSVSYVARGTEERRSSDMKYGEIYVYVYGDISMNDNRGCYGDS